MPKDTLKKAPSVEVEVVPDTPAVIDSPDDQQLGAELTAYFHDAVDGIKRVLLFGAKFLEIEDRVTVVTRSGHHDTKGQGIKGWLATYAPDVGRAQAYKFRDIAGAILDKFHVEISEALRIFTADLDTLPEAEARKRAKVLDYMTGKSLRGIQLELGLTTSRGARGGDRGGRRPRKDDKPLLASLEEQRAAAIEWYQSNILLLRNHWLEGQDYKHLPDLAEADGEVTLPDLYRLLRQAADGAAAELKSRGLPLPKV